MQNSAEALPVSLLLRRAIEEAARLFGLELESVKIEMGRKAKAAGAGAAAVVVAVVFIALSVVALTLCAIDALSLVVASWLAALIVTIVWLVIAGVLALVGLRLIRKALPPVPTDTLHALKEDVQWANRTMSVRTSSRPSNS